MINRAARTPWGLRSVAPWIGVNGPGGVVSQCPGLVTIPTQRRWHQGPCLLGLPRSSSAFVLFNSAASPAAFHPISGVPMSQAPHVTCDIVHFITVMWRLCHFDVHNNCTRTLHTQFLLDNLCSLMKGFEQKIIMRTFKLDWISIQLDKDK